jgi:heptosyltransferase II
MPQRILVRSPNWIGDQILAYPFFFALRALYPQAQIGAVSVPWVQSIQFRSLVNDSFVYDRNNPQDKHRVDHEIRAHGPWDLGFVLPNSFSSAWEFFRWGVRNRRGYRGDFRSLLLDEARAVSPPGLHRSKVYLGLLESEIKASRFNVDHWIHQALEKFQPEQDWGTDPQFDRLTEPYWVLAPGSQADSRRWPLEKFASVAQSIHQRWGYRLVVVGGPREKELADQLAKSVDFEIYSLCGLGSVADHWKLFKGARFMLTNDSGLAHVASLCGTSTHIVWGAGNPEHTRPLSLSPQSLTVNRVACWPCEKNVCGQTGTGFRACLEGSSVKSVEDAIFSQRGI